mgnify:CR=1 FL=1
MNERTRNIKKQEIINFIGNSSTFVKGSREIHSFKLGISNKNIETETEKTVEFYDIDDAVKFVKEINQSYDENKILYDIKNGLAECFVPKTEPFYLKFSITKH